MHLHHTALSGAGLRWRPGVTDYGHRRRRQCELLTHTKRLQGGTSAQTTLSLASSGSTARGS